MVCANHPKSNRQPATVPGEALALSLSLSHRFSLDSLCQNPTATEETMCVLGQIAPSLLEVAILMGVNLTCAPQVNYIAQSNTIAN
jgi:hypothetical protein